MTIVLVSSYTSPPEMIDDFIEYTCTEMVFIISDINGGVVRVWYVCQEAFRLLD